jgi:hypothetical protein
VACQLTLISGLHLVEGPSSFTPRIQKQWGMPGPVQSGP